MMDPIVKHAISIQHRIQMALNTEETGDDLVFVARTAREAELTLARIERLLDAAGSNLQALIAMLEDQLGGQNDHS